MAKKIILFFSPLSAKAAECIYDCPDGTAVIGKQTNEAPVKYLLAAHPDVTEVLCIVTEAARASAWDCFEAAIREEHPDVSLTQIPFHDGEAFADGPLPRVMDRVAPGDTILLETTGGFRNDVMHLLLLSRILSYAGVETQDAVYSSLQDNRIRSIKHLVGLFDLVGGMQELSSFGSVRGLRAYYQGTQDASIRRLLLAAEKLTEDISLCRTRQLEGHMADFDAALTGAERCGDPLMRQLLPAFRRKFGKKMTVPGVIKWCLESDMLQQALTIYKERVPYYLMNHPSGLLRVKPSAPPLDVKEYQSEEEARFYVHFLNMAEPNANRYRAQPEERWRATVLLTLEHFDELLLRSNFTTSGSTDRLCAIARDYLYIRTLRNMINHANDQTIGFQKELNEYFREYNYPPLEGASSSAITSVLRKALDHLKG